MIKSLHILGELMSGPFDEVELLEWDAECCQKCFDHVLIILNAKFKQLKRALEVVEIPMHVGEQDCDLQCFQ